MLKQEIDFTELHNLNDLTKAILDNQIAMQQVEETKKSIKKYQQAYIDSFIFKKTEIDNYINSSDIKQYCENSFLDSDNDKKLFNYRETATFLELINEKEFLNDLLWFIDVVNKRLLHIRDYQSASIENNILTIKFGYKASEWSWINGSCESYPVTITQHIVKIDLTKNQIIKTETDGEK